MFTHDIEKFQADTMNRKLGQGGSAQILVYKPGMLVDPFLLGILQLHRAHRKFVLLSFGGIPQDTEYTQNSLEKRTGSESDYIYSACAHITSAD